MVPHMVSELVRGLGSGGGQDVAATFRPSATKVATCAPTFQPVVKAARRKTGQHRRLCCSMYWRRTEIGAAPTEPAK